MSAVLLIQALFETDGATTTFVLDLTKAPFLLQGPVPNFDSKYLKAVTHAASSQSGVTFTLNSNQTVTIVFASAPVAPLVEVSFWLAT